MGFADLHIHSLNSYDGTASVSAILKYTADFTNLNVIAISDHDSLRGGQEALDLASKYNMQVIPGCEISSKDGHVLALFIDRPVAAGLSLVETVHLVGEQGGICIAAHPMAKGVNSLTFPILKNALEQPGISKTLVGIETFNGGLVYTRRNQSVAEGCRTLPLAQMGNSDAHILQVIGQGASFFPGENHPGSYERDSQPDHPPPRGQRPERSCRADFLYPASSFAEIRLGKLECRPANLDQNRFNLPSSGCPIHFLGKSLLLI